MAKTEDEIKAELRPMLGKAGKAGERIGNWLLAIGLGLGVGAAGLAYWRLSQPDLDFGGFMAGLLGLGVGGMAVVIMMSWSSLLDTGRCRRLAETFRSTFPTSTGDYQLAVEVLKGAEGSGSIALDLLGALHEDVTFKGETKPVGAPTKDKEDNTDLLGDFDSDEKKKKSNADTSDNGDLMPIDPMDGGDGGGDD